MQTPADTTSGSFLAPLTGIELVDVLRVLGWLFIGLPTVLGVSRWFQGWVARRSTAQRGLVVGKIIWYAGLVAVLLTVLAELGFSLAPLLGAAGILGIALGFASQTSVSNVISGLFLMAEQPFVVGDIITVGQHTGVVLSIDMISVKLRTFDNRFIRIPNETMVKSEVVTVTRFPIRRVDVNVGVAYKEDIARVKDVLLAVAKRNPICLMEPEPVLIFQGYGESSLNFLLGVWAARENWLELKNTIHEEIKEAFDEAGIEIPFPHRTLYVGATTDPFPIELVDASRGAGAGASEVDAREPDAGAEDAPGSGAGSGGTGEAP